MSSELDGLYPAPTPDPVRAAGRACDEAHSEMLFAEVLAYFGDKGSKENLSKARKAYAQTHGVLTAALAKCDFCKSTSALDLAISGRETT